jgi:antibiotic biosynthesis monooxygenase (ABM) superfamily enzyme
MSGEGVSVAVARTVKPGREGEYEAWLSRAIAAARAFPGHRGADVLRPEPGSRRYVLLFRYATLDQLMAWEASDERRRLVAEADSFTEGAADAQRIPGLVAWFTLPGGALPPPRWKMAIVTWAVAFPLIQALNAALGPLLTSLHPLARGALTGAAMVLIMTYAAMPLVTRALARWLFTRRP